MLLTSRIHQWSGLQGVQGGGNLGGLAGQRITLHRKKFHFPIILNKINIKFFEKSLDLANFVNFADLPQGGVRGTTPPPIGEPCLHPKCKHG